MKKRNKYDSLVEGIFSSECCLEEFEFAMEQLGLNTPAAMWGALSADVSDKWLEDIEVMISLIHSGVVAKHMMDCQNDKYVGDEGMRILAEFLCLDRPYSLGLPRSGALQVLIDMGYVIPHRLGVKVGGLKMYAINSNRKVTGGGGGININGITYN